MPSELAPAVFLDRDGTLMEDVDYCNDPTRVRIFPGVPKALARLKEAGFRNVIVTNQSGIGRGLITVEQFAAVQKKLLELIGADLIQATYHCPDVPGPNAHRRKPSPAMVMEAAGDLGLDLGRSWFIGDKASDIQCGCAAGVRTILVLTGDGDDEPRDGALFVAKDFASAAEFILRNASVR